MPDYDFRNLSPIDFEVLVRDLIQEELRIRLESFKVGRDKGIDFRYCPNKDQNLIVQAKRYIDTDYRSLFRALKRDEVPKVKQLNPSRYILAISLGLTPVQKDNIVSLFQPFILSPSDVFAREDLNGLLYRHPKIERQHFKLWMASAAIFEEILNSKLKNASRDELEKIRAHAKFYVQNESFRKALKILDTHNFCIIAGIPGIGKTILAEMICLYFVNLGYEAVKVTGDISEASGLDYIHQKRLFYYDDFLGQTSLLDKLNKNEDQRLLDFIQAIQRSKISKLILTTREYILNQARRVYEKLAMTRFDLQTFIIDLSYYTRRIRAQILYNHIYFSDLTSHFKKKILENKRYIEIIDHPNYNPRIIQFMTDPLRLSGVQPSEYWKIFRSNLDNPKDIWKHAFEEQLSQEARNLLLVMSTLPKEVFMEDLEKAFDVFHNKYAKNHGCDIRGVDFEHAIRELESSFVISKKSRERTVVQFVNPSIQDFMTQYIIEQHRCYKDLIDCSIFHEQISWLWDIYQSNIERIGLFYGVDDIAGGIIGRLQFTMPGPSCQLVNYTGPGGSMYKDVWPICFEDRAILLAKIAAATNGPAVQSLFDHVVTKLIELMSNKTANREGLVRLLRAAKLAGVLKEYKREPFLQAAKEFIINGIKYINEYRACADFLTDFSRILNEEELEIIKSSFKKFSCDLDSYESDPDIIRADVEELRSIGMLLCIDTSSEELRLENRAAEIEEETSLVAEPDYDNFETSREIDYCSDEDIKSMFSTLGY